METRININVSTIDYDKTSKVLTKQLSLLEEMVHSQEDFVMTDSEFAFGWHFFVLSVNRSLVQKLMDVIGPDFEKLKGKGMEKKRHRSCSCGHHKKPYLEEWWSYFCCSAS